MGSRTIVETNGESLDNEPNSLMTSATGCLYLLILLVVSTGMLVVNAIVCLSVHSVLKIFGPSAIVDNPSVAPHLFQLFFFVVPILLTFVEWNLLDRLSRMFLKQ